MFGSNFDWDIAILSEVFRDFPHSLLADAGEVLRLGHDRFLPNHHSSFNSHTIIQAPPNNPRNQHCISCIGCVFTEREGW
jgi:hypothetical protein